jgi:uncharacterized protein (UPF0212 family)
MTTNKKELNSEETTISERNVSVEIAKAKCVSKSDTFKSLYVVCLISLVLLIGELHWLVIDDCRTSIKIVQSRKG